MFNPPPAHGMAPTPHTNPSPFKLTNNYRQALCVNSSMTLSIRNLSLLVRPVLDEVVGPDVVAMLGPQPDARSVRQPEPSAFGLLPGDLQPLASPNPLDPLVVDEPACSAQQLGDLAVAVASGTAQKLDDVGPEPLLVVSTTRDLALRRAMLAERRAGDARIHPAPGERARCRPGDARGLEVSPGCLLQDQLVQRQVGNRSAQPRCSQLISLVA